MNRKKVMVIILLVIGTVIMLLAVKKNTVNQEEKVKDGLSVPALSVGGRVYWHITDVEDLPDGFEFYGVIQRTAKTLEEVAKNELYSIRVEEGSKVWVNPEQKEVICVKREIYDYYYIFVENGFYQNDLINIEGKVYIDTSDLLSALKGDKDVYGDISWSTDISEIEDINTDYDKELSAYERLGTIHVGEEFGFPTEDMSCPIQCTILDGEEVFRHIEEGYLVVGRIRYENEVYGTKFILNEP